MAIAQGDTLCTMGCVDLATGLGVSAGHCAVSNDVRDDAGDVVGRVIAARNNRAGKPTQRAYRPGDRPRGHPTQPCRNGHRPHRRPTRRGPWSGSDDHPSQE